MPGVMVITHGHQVLLEDFIVPLHPKVALFLVEQMMLPEELSLNGTRRREERFAVQFGKAFINRSPPIAKLQRCF